MTGTPAAEPAPVPTDPASLPIGPASLPIGPASLRIGPASLRIGTETAGRLEDAERLEWLVANGIGGYASGTVAGSLSRGYHGLLVAARRPPVDRRLLLVKVDETASYRGRDFALATNRWASGAVAPEGLALIASFELEGSVPCWRYALDDAVLEKRIWMEHGANSSYVAWTLARGDQPVRLTVQAITDDRVFHNTGQVAWPVQVAPLTPSDQEPGGSGAGLQVTAGGPDASPLRLLTDSGEASPAADLNQGYLLPAEADRGLNDVDSHGHTGTFTATLAPGATLTLLASTEAGATIRSDALAQRRARDADVLAAWAATRPAGADPPPAWVARLVLAADQFVVARRTPEQPDGMSVIAGYHWFEDWGRDTMVSLPGLALVTGRPEVSAAILRAFAQFVSDGMLPNRFPDAADQPVYNTVDATLWYVQAIREHLAATGDEKLLADLWPTLADIVAWHLKGTRYGIKVDPVDGLLQAGEPGVQLTWMDAIVNGRVITPRIGKPVEVNALWYNALVAMAEFADRLGEDGTEYRSQAETTARGFARFFNQATGYCFDVLDGPDGDDPALRPNQLFALSLPSPLLEPEQRRAVLDACAQTLLTPRGLRSLAPGEAAYVGHYAGDQEHRDGSYHQGTVWAWLLGPFVAAHLRVHDDPDAAAGFLDPLADHLGAAGLGSISEIFDGDAPFTPQGCVAQAWSVAEVLRAWTLLDRHRT